jgi:hypothetical protein
MYYKPYKYPKRKIILITTLFYTFWAALEIPFSIWLRPVYANGTEWPNLIFGIIATVFLSIGLLPPYWELSKRKGRVVGINFIFLALDSSGAIFSMASMCVGEFDPMGMTLYAVIIALEFGLFISQGIWMIRFRSWKRDNSEKNDQISLESNLEQTSQIDQEELNDGDEDYEAVYINGQISKK